MIFALVLSNAATAQLAGESVESSERITALLIKFEEDERFIKDMFEHLNQIEERGGVSVSQMLEMRKTITADDFIGIAAQRLEDHLTDSEIE